MKKNAVLLVLAAALMLFPILYQPNADFEGTDGQAVEMITTINPDYQPWFASVWSPPSGEVESFLFVLQGALGAGFIGYYLGYIKGKKEKEN